MEKTMTIENGRLYKYWGEEKEVRIPEGVTSIEPKAFFKSQVEEIWLPDSLISIHRDAFRYSNLKIVYFGNGLTGISENAFSNCDGLKLVELPDSVRSVGSGAFSHTDEVCCSHYVSGADLMFHPLDINIYEMPATYTAVITIGKQSLRVPRDMQIKEKDLKNIFCLETLTEKEKAVAKENMKNMYLFSEALEGRLRTGCFFAAAEMADMDNNQEARDYIQGFKGIITNAVKSPRDKKALEGFRQKFNF